MYHAAIYQGLSHHHYELIMHALEYCLKNNMKTSIYTHTNMTSQAYRQSFDAIFDDRNTTWKDLHTFNPDHYEVIFLVTDDDPSFCHWGAAHKTICIDHYHLIRTHQPFAFRINTRRFPNRPNDPYVLSVCRAPVPSVAKKQNYIANNPIRIMTLGGSTAPPCPDVLDRLFGPDHRAKSIEFHFVSRHFNLYPNFYEVYKNTPNVHIYTDLPPEACFDLLRKCNYLLCYPMRPDYITDAVSGAIFMAYMFMCKLIIPESWQNNVHDFTSAILFSEINPSHSPIDVTSSHHLDLHPVAEERERIISQRDALFDDAIRRIQCLDTS